MAATCVPSRKHAVHPDLKAGSMAERENGGGLVFVQIEIGLRVGIRDWGSRSTVAQAFHGIEFPEQHQPVSGVPANRGDSTNLVGGSAIAVAIGKLQVVERVPMRNSQPTTEERPALEINLVIARGGLTIGWIRGE